MSGSTHLVRYDAMCRAIAEAHAVDEVKDIRDKARAMEMYAQQAMNKEDEERVRAIRIRAERKCGELLANGGERAERGRPTKMSSDATLSELGISRDQSSQWQKLAAVPEDLFEQGLAEPNPSTTGIITRHEVAQREPISSPGNKQALWLWGRLQDFEERGLLDEHPSAMLEDIHDHMRATILEMAPRVAAWLKGIGK